MHKLIYKILKENDEEDIDSFFKPKNISSREEKLCQEKFHMSTDELKDIYFSFYDQMDEPERSRAKQNFDIEKVINLGVPSHLLKAIEYSSADDWQKNEEEAKYWGKVYSNYTRKHLKRIYFLFYDQLDEPYKTQAKQNFDMNYALKYTVPNCIFDAISRGFEISETKEGFNYWKKLLEKYN